MTELQHKISVVEQYLLVMGKRGQTGHPIKITFKNQDNTEELTKLDIAYSIAVKYFTR